MVKKLSTTCIMRLALCLMMMCLPLGVWADGNTTWTLVGEKCGTCSNGDNGVISFQNLNNTAWGGGSVAGHTELSYPNCQGTQFSGSMPVADQKLISISQYEHSEVVPAHTKVVRKCVFQTVMATARYRHGLGLYLFDDLASATTTNLDAMPDQNAKALGNSIPEANLLLQQTDNDGFHSKEMVVRDVVYDNSASDTEQTIKKYIVLVHVNTSGTTNLGVTGLEWAGFREMSDIDINFIPNGGTGIMDDQVITSSGTLNDCTYILDGHSFIGWNTKADGSGTTYAVGTTFTYSDETKGLIKLYALWEPFTVWNYKAEQLVNPKKYSQTPFMDVNGNALTYTNKWNKLDSIGTFAFNGVLAKIERSVFSNNVDLIGDLTLPNTVQEIGGRAFCGCNWIKGLTLSNSLRIIGDEAFSECYRISGNLTIPNSVTSIGKYAFYCTGFTGNLTIGSSVQTIGDHAFEGCSGFTGNLTIGNSVTSIGDYAFNECTGFTGNLTIGNSVTSIGESAFCVCTGFTGNLTIGNSVTSIGDYAFQDCSNFTGSLTIPNSVTSIGKDAFIFCTGFNGRLTIGNSVQTIGEMAFYQCQDFTGATLKSIPNVGMDAFLNVNNLTLALGDSSYVAADKGSFPDLIAAPTYTREMSAEWETVVVPFAIAYDVHNTDYKLYQLVSASGSNLGINEYANGVIIPAGTPMLVKAIGGKNSNGKYEVTIKAADKSVNTAITAPSAPYGLTFTGTYAATQVVAGGGYVLSGNKFVKITAATTIAPFRAYLAGSIDGVSSIDMFDADIVVTFDANGGSGSMAQQVFTGSEALTANAFTRDGYQFVGWRMAADGGLYYPDESVVNITGSLTLYAWWAPADNTVWHYTATSLVKPFYGDSFEDADGQNLSYTNVFNGETKDGVFVFDGTLVSIGDCAFYECTGFSGTLTIPNSVTSIGYNAFYECTGFSGSLTIPNSVTSIGDCAFYECTGFSGSLTIPNSVTSIKQGVFKECSGFTGSLSIPNSIKSIGDCAFYGCTGFSDVTIKSIPSVDYGAFSGVTSNKTLVLDDNSYIASNKGVFPSLTAAPTYSRQMSTQWGTIVVPFAVSLDGSEPYDLYEVTSVADGALNLQKVSSLAAGTPALIRMSAAAKNAETGKYDLTLTAANTSVTTTGELTATEKSGLTLTGTYSKKVLTEEKGYIINNNSFWDIATLHRDYPSSEISIGAFRAYLANSTSGGAAQLRISAEEATALEVLDSLSSGAEPVEVYDLNGRRQDDLREGVNIIKKGNKSVKIVIK